MNAIFKNTPIRQEKNLEPSRMPWPIVLAWCVGMFSLSSVAFTETTIISENGEQLTSVENDLETTDAKTTPLNLKYKKTDLQDGTFRYHFTLSVDNEDGSFVLGHGWRWLIFGDTESAKSPMADFKMDFNQFPVGPWTGLGLSGEYKAPTFTPVFENWYPNIGDKLEWSGTSTFNAQQGELLFSSIAQNTGAVSPNLQVAIEIDSKLPGTLQFLSANYSINEGSRSVTITVVRTGGSDGTVSVDYATSNGTANAESDYTAVSGTLEWDDQVEGTQTFTVNITDDGDVEDNETFTIGLSNTTGDATIQFLDAIVVTIVDNDNKPPLSDCHAIYSATDKKIIIPLLKIPLLDPLTGEPTDNTAVFKGELEMIDGVEDFKIIPDSLEFMEMLESDSECHATYLHTNRMIHIPFVDVPSVVVLPPDIVVPGPTQVFQAYLQQLPLSDDVFHLKCYKYLYTIED